MQINAGGNVPVYGIRVQGRAYYNNGQYVTSVTVQHSADGSTWIYVDGGATFTGVSGSFGNFDARFASPVMAQYIRITVVTWSGHISMRAGLLVDPIAVNPIAVNPPEPSPPPPSSAAYSWFDSSEHCSTSEMQSFGWTRPVYGGCKTSSGRGYYWFYRSGGSSESISIPLPTGYSDFTIEYGQSCYSYAGASVNIQLNGVVVSSVDNTCAAGTSCYVYPPVESCLRTFSMKYSPGDVLTISEVGVSIAYIKTIKMLAPSPGRRLSEQADPASQA
eukprot:scaffold84995_cov60-Phaeocystis_antarctica.AAC.1